MPTKWWLKPLALKTSFLLAFFIAIGSAGAESLVNENVTKEDVIEILQLPMKERLMRLKEIESIRDRLRLLAFDHKQTLDVRWRSLTALGSLGARSYRWEIEEALKSKEWFMRNAGLLAVQHDEREVAIRWSKKLLQDSALVVRTQAVKNLIDLKAEARDEIWSGLWAKNNFHEAKGLWIRNYMAEALVQWARPVDEKRFLRLLMEHDETIQRWAILGLERSTGLKLSTMDEPIALQKRKWLSRLSSDQI